MQIKVIDSKPFWVKVPKHYETGEYLLLSGTKFTKARPKQEEGYRLYKFTRYYEIIPTEKEKSDFVKKYEWSKNGKSFADFYKEITGNTDYFKTVYRYELVEDYYNFVDFRKSGNFNTDFDKIPYTVTFADHMYIIKLEDGKLITDYSKAEILEKQKKSEQEAEFKVISNVLKASIDNILGKYGMELRNDGVRFKNNSEYFKFVKLSLMSVIDELNKNGYEAKLNPRVRAIKYSSLIVNKKDISLKKIEELST